MNEVRKPLKGELWMSETHDPAHIKEATSNWITYTQHGKQKIKKTVNFLYEFKPMNIEREMK